ncbi:MAG: P1 family peptidase [Armatimonadia bacterium]
MSSPRPRARDLGVSIGELQPGPLNAIVDVPEVAVGHVSLVAGEGPLVSGQGPVRTGVTAILPHPGNLFTDRVCAAVEVINGFGKSVGLPQVTELGSLETPILLTNTLSVWTAADALADFMAELNPGVRSFNPVVGECNDGALNDILGRHVKPQHVRQALAAASRVSVQEGNVGAGVGMTGFGWKAGIGTASRLLPGALDGYVLGSLVLTNTGSARDLRVDGVPVGRHLRPPAQPLPAGSIIIVLATDAPLDSRQLRRLAKRAAFGLARVGGIADHGSGDFVIAFSTGNRLSARGEQRLLAPALVPETELSSLFRATIETVEEAILNSLFRAETMVGRDALKRLALPLDELSAVLRTHGGAPRNGD